MTADAPEPGANAQSPWRVALGLRFGGRRSLPVILQAEASECGLACLAMVASYHGHDVDLPGLRRRFPGSLKGMDLAQIIAMAGALQLLGRPLRLELNELVKLQLPCIVHWRLNHFVVLKRVDRRGAVIHDPARGEQAVSMKELSEAFTGVALELSPTKGFVPEQMRPAISLSQLTGAIRGVVPSLVQIASLALALEAFAVLSPFFMQWVMDQVLPSADRELLGLLCAAFVFLLLMQTAFGAARSWAVCMLSARIGIQWVGNVVDHLLRLPLAWFERRHIGDVVSRLGSIQFIQRTLTTQFIGAALDGLMSVVTLVVLSIYSLQLTAIVLGIFALYVALRLAVFAHLKRLTEDQIACAARQQSELLEAIRGVMPIKLFNQESERSSRYVNSMVETANRDIRIQRFGLIFGSINQSLFGMGRIAIIWIGALRAIDGGFSAGMLIAFLAYVDQFTSRAGGLVDKWIEFRMLRLHAERLADIALSEPEQHLKPDGLGSAWAGDLNHGDIEFRHVSFRYSPADDWVVRRFSLKVHEGESVAIVGPSGCGKTTLAKIMLGLLEPEEGEVLFGGVPLKRLGMSRYRSLVAAVMQDDHLFAGSIADNIAFFSNAADQDRVRQAARLAAVDRDIQAMPMGYHSLIGDMGSSLSGGQKQRVLLARALYREPRLLLLDEATSHLDVQRERSICASVASLNMTRIVIAHRPETIASADRVIDLGAGACNDQRMQLVEVV